MYTVTVIFHILACMALILIVLLQTGRGAEMGAAFGGASQTLFGGAGGTTFLSKLTTAAAVVFMITCLGLTYLSEGPRTKSIMEGVEVEKPQGPALPEARPVLPSEATPAMPALPVPAQPSGNVEAPAAPAQPSQVAPESSAGAAPSQSGAVSPESQAAKQPAKAGKEPAAPQKQAPPAGKPKK